MGAAPRVSTESWQHAADSQLSNSGFLMQTPQSSGVEPTAGWASARDAEIRGHLLTLLEPSKFMPSHPHLQLVSHD